MDHAQLPLVERGAYRPPIIGYDHRVYILGDGLIQAIGPDGKLVWEQRTSQRPAGAAITLDGQLLVTEGNTVFAYSRRGEPTRLYSAGRQELTTAPVLTRKRGLLVASGREFYCLEAKPVERH
jgi:outer membrane protein assembly factor BamB